jgi:hypothetical protein
VQIAGRLHAGKHPLLDGHAGTPSIATPDGMTGGGGARGGGAPIGWRAQSMIPKSGYRFSEKIMLQQEAGAG